MTVIQGADAIHANIGHLPAGVQAAGYTTGSEDIRWTNQDFDDHPGAVRIDQDPGASDGTADVLDFENGAAVEADLAPWSEKALNSYRTNARPGQRSPAIYASQDNLTAVVNALVAGGVHGGIGLFVADWSVTQAEAEGQVNNASGPFPVVAFQYSNQGGGGTYDEDVFSKDWLDTVSPLPAAGPTRHEVTGTVGASLGEIADQRHTTIAHLLATSESAAITAAHLKVLQDYIQLEADMITAGMDRPAAPNGLIYYTSGS